MQRHQYESAYPPRDPITNPTSQGMESEDRQQTTTRHYSDNNTRHRNSQEDRQGNQHHKGKWIKVVDVHGFRAEEIKVRVNPIFHTVEVSAQRLSSPWHSAQTSQACNKLKRVIPLPENICMEKLRVHMNTERGEVTLKAPFKSREDMLTKKQCQQQHHGVNVTGSSGSSMDRSTSNCVNIPIQWKTCEPSSECLSNLHLTPQRRITPTDVNKCSVQDYLRLLKQSISSRNSMALGMPSDVPVNKTLATEVVKDENTGKWKLLLDINAVGFRREEIEVNFQEKDRLVVVEMNHDTMKQKTRLTPGQPQQPEPTGTTSTTTTMTPPGTGVVSMKHVREEILVPEWLDGKQLRFRLMENGVLRIQMPCLREPMGNMSKKSQMEKDEEEKWNRNITPTL